ncbi:LOW QUALITY PROTEIN: hypothetical protein KUTeg_012749 [Tegillarca granosa]|uniref:Tyr recombinase domain-containing protein n=1 Tax=Tegillarca granosa TaxID=220873 RepID=A0ABQ9F0E1_TEGGR|nr:LOW QUALITY PROTEIN: hypothetical protein KUTeg_012749 [Tegillarca granosa]
MENNSEFLSGSNTEFERFSKSELNDKLILFYASKKKGVNYKSSSFTNLKYGLSKYLKDNCSIDLSDSEFSSSNAIFKAVNADLKTKGLGSVDHKSPISEEHLRQLYNPWNVAFNIHTPSGLQNKVWFDVMYFLCRRGQENLRQMNKSTFAVGVDSRVADTTNTPDDTIGEDVMYSRPNDVMCPVYSFKKYLSKIHPQLEDLWQRPLDSFEEDALVWYCKSPLGKNTLADMLKTISEQSKLSYIYTYHSIRATTITALDNAGIEARHIMRAFGHKNESSIRSYSFRLSERSVRCRECLSTALNSSVSDKADSNTSIGNIDDISADELHEIFNDENLEFLNSNDKSKNPDNIICGPTQASSMVQDCVSGTLAVRNDQEKSAANGLSTANIERLTNLREITQFLQNDVFRYRSSSTMNRIVYRMLRFTGAPFGQDKLVIAKLKFLKLVASVLQPFLEFYQTDKPVLPCMAADLTPLFKTATGLSGKQETLNVSALLHIIALDEDFRVFSILINKGLMDNM